MNCVEARKWISPYLDSELGPTKTFEVSEHLRKCAACATRFEREREADALMRSRLERTAMPAALWDQIGREVVTPRWVRRLRSRTTLAAAACVALVLAGATLFRDAMRQTDRPGVVAEFLALRPQDRPFVPADGAGTVSFADALNGALSVPVALRPMADQADHHRVGAVTVAARTDERGRKYAELRLNCCGHPVLLVLAEPTDGRWPVPFVEASRRDGTVIDGINVAAVDLGAVRAVAVSRHPVADVVSRLHV